MHMLETVGVNSVDGVAIELKNCFCCVQIFVIVTLGSVIVGDN